MTDIRDFLARTVNNDDWPKYTRAYDCADAILAALKANSIPADALQALIDGDAVVVPVEATDEMHEGADAVMRPIIKTIIHREPRPHWAAVELTEPSWAAMLAASPYWSE